MIFQQRAIERQHGGGIREVDRGASHRIWPDEAGQLRRVLNQRRKIITLRMPVARMESGLGRGNLNGRGLAAVDHGANETVIRTRDVLSTAGACVADDSHRKSTAMSMNPFCRVSRLLSLACVLAGLAAVAGGTQRLRAATDAPVYATIDEAIARGDVADVKRHLQRDPAAVRGKPDAKLSPLHQAILRRQAKIVGVLLEHGADVQAPDTAGRTPLHLAVERGDAVIVKELLGRKADPSKRDRIGWTPLHHAAAKTRLEIATLLLDAKMNPNLLSELGGTALHEAAAAGSVEMVKLLLDRGVDPSVRSKPGVTALDLAREYKHPEVVALLETRK